MKIEATASEWSAALKATLPHTGTDKTLPVLVAVRFEQDETGAYLAATDRYTLIMRKVETSDPGTLADPSTHGAVMIATADVQRIVKAAADWTRVSVPLTLSADGGRVTFTTPDSSTTFAALDAQFPAYRTLIASAVDKLGDYEHNRASDARVSAALLAKWAKSAGKNEAVQIRLTADQKVVVVAGSDFIGLQMPARSPDGFSVPSWTPGAVAPAPVEAVA